MYARVVLITIIALGIISVALWKDLYERNSQQLTVAFLDVGQGDAIFIESPTGAQVLIDGGPDRSVLRELAKVMSWHDRSIDVIVATHPDADHVSGLIDVLQRYRVSTIIEPQVNKDTVQAQSMLVSVAGEGAQHIIARRGQIIDIGGGAFLDVLHPDRAVITGEPNEVCIVTRLVYGETAFMLPCDAPSGVEKYLVALDPLSVKAQVLKAGHHGSKTSSSDIFLRAVAPEYVVFPRGCENKYGHPHTEVTQRFENQKIPILDTCRKGSVHFVSNGQVVQILE